MRMHHETFTASARTQDIKRITPRLIEPASLSRRQPFWTDKDHFKTTIYLSLIALDEGHASYHRLMGAINISTPIKPRCALRRTRRARRGSARVEQRVEYLLKISNMVPQLYHTQFKTRSQYRTSGRASLYSGLKDWKLSLMH